VSDPFASPEPEASHAGAPRPWATYALIGVSIVVALASKLGENGAVLTVLTLAPIPEERTTVGEGLQALLHGEVWRLITPIFIHFGPWHLLFNMLWLRDLGSLIERRWSTLTLLALVGGSAVAANLAQYVVNWDLADGVRFANALSGGMSGVVYCLLGYLWMRGRHDPTAGVRLHPQTVLMMMVWLVLCCTGALGRIGNTAHAVGLLVGVVWGRVAAARASAPAP
jgi:GlpG protein